MRISNDSGSHEFISIPCMVGEKWWIADKKRNKVYTFHINIIKIFQSGISLHGYAYGKYHEGGCPIEITVGKTTFKRLLHRTKEQAETILN